MPDTSSANRQGTADTARQVGNVASSGVSRARASAPGRKVFGFMAVAVLFSVIGAEIRNVQATSTPGTQTTGLAKPKAPASPNVPGLFYEPPLIFLAGTVATAGLVLLTDTGSVGETLGVGLAGLSMVTALLVNGGPVWRAIGGAVGSKPTTPLGSTTGTTPSTSTTSALVTTAPIILAS